jgi:hypothetical protein
VCPPSVCAFKSAAPRISHTSFTYRERPGSTLHMRSKIGHKSSICDRSLTKCLVFGGQQDLCAVQFILIGLQALLSVSPSHTDPRTHTHTLTRALWHRASGASAASSVMNGRPSPGNVAKVLPFDFHASAVNIFSSAQRWCVGYKRLLLRE